jgi:hypothetical protein
MHGLPSSSAAAAGARPAAASNAAAAAGAGKAVDLSSAAVQACYMSQVAALAHANTSLQQELLLEVVSHEQELVEHKVRARCNTNTVQLTGLEPELRH